MAGKATDKDFAKKAVSKAFKGMEMRTPLPSPKLRQVKTEQLKMK